jgi:methyl-accepting chemotaxis protein
LTVEELPGTGHDEIAEMERAFNRMVENLRSLVRDVDISAETVAGAAQQLTGIAEPMAQATGDVGQRMARVAATSSVPQARSLPAQTSRLAVPRRSP